MLKLKKNNEPIIATIDIETYPAEVLMYGKTWEPVIVKINRFQSILSMAFKIGDSKTKYVGLNTIKGYKKGDLDDKKLMQEIHNILKDVDVIVGQNSDEFDIKIIKERLMFHNLPALPSDIITLDTKKLYKKVSRLPNNKLDTISQFNGIGQKVEHNGTNLFLACGEGDEKSWKLNEKYNKKDVDLCYENLKKVLPYVNLEAKQKVFTRNIQCSNPLCLSNHLTIAKYRKVKNGWKIQYQCQDCGSYKTDDNLIKDDNKNIYNGHVPLLQTS